MDCIPACTKGGWGSQWGRVNTFLGVWSGTDITALWAAPSSSLKGQGRGEKDEGSQLCLNLYSSEDCDPPGIYPLASSCMPGAGEGIIHGTHCPQDHPALSHPGIPQPHSRTFELTLPQQCLCGSAQVPSIDQSVPARSKRRQSQWGTQNVQPPMHPDCKAVGGLTWYLSYTTGRVNIDTTAEEKKSTVLNSCWSDPSREETYFEQGQTRIMPLGQLIHQGSSY